MGRRTGMPRKGGGQADLRRGTSPQHRTKFSIRYMVNLRISDEKSVSRFIEKKLRLNVNRQKSAVGRPWDRKYLGFCLTNSRKTPKIRIHWKTIKRFRERVRQITARRRGRSIAQVIGELNNYMRGWWKYYSITESYNRLRPPAHWIRRRLRALIWKQWKNRKTRVRELLKRGIRRIHALTTGCARKGP